MKNVIDPFAEAIDFFSNSENFDLDELSDWEVSFIESVVGKFLVKERISVKQIDTIVKIRMNVVMRRQISHNDMIDIYTKVKREKDLREDKELRS